MNFSPDHFRRAQEMMSNMDPQMMNQMMSMVNNNPELMKQAMNMTQAQFARPHNPAPEHESIFLNKIDHLKSQGNEHFKKSEFKSAGSIYQESLQEIKKFREKYPNIYLKNELRDLENKIELNFSRSKLNLGDLGTAIESARKVHLRDKGGKSAYYWALGLWRAGRLEEALVCANKSREIQPGEAVEKMINDILIEIGEKVDGDNDQKSVEKISEQNLKKKEKEIENEDADTKMNGVDFEIKREQVKELNDDEDIPLLARQNDNFMKKEDNFVMEQVQKKSKTNSHKTIKTLGNNQRENIITKINSFVLRHLKFFIGVLIGLLISYFLELFKLKDYSEI